MFKRWIISQRGSPPAVMKFMYVPGTIKALEAQPLTAPAVIPSIRYFWKIR